MASLKKTPLIFLSILMAGAMLGNIWTFPLFFGLQFMFGSIFTLIIIRYFGALWGIAAALLAGLYPLFHSVSPFLFFLLLLEALTVGYFTGYKKINLLITDCFFWLIPGTVLIGVFYSGVLSSEHSSVLISIITLCINGIFNALIACLILMPSPLRRRGQRKEQPVSFQEILFSVLLAFILLPMLINLIYDSYNETEKIMKEIQEQTYIASSVLSAQLNYWQESHFTPIIELAEMLKNQTVQPSGALQDHLKIIRQSFPDFHNLYIADKDATTVAFYPETATDGSSAIGLNFSDRSYYRQVKQELQPVISDVFNGRGGVNEPIVTLSAPIFHSGQFNGYVLGALNLQRIAQLVHHEVKDQQFLITVLDRQGTVIVSSDPTLETNTSFSKQQPEIPLSDQPRLYLRQPKGESLPALKRWEESSYIFSQPVEGKSSWHLWVEVPFKPYIHDVYSMYVNILTIAFSGILIALLFTFFLSRFLLSPLQSLTNITKNLHEKILKQEAIAWPKSGIKEIRLLMMHYQSMSDKFLRLLKKNKLSQKSLEQLAHYDTLTGLPNQTFFKKHLRQQIKKKKEHSGCLAILFVDLDRFKMINDTFGHDIGDQLLREVAKRLKTLFPKQDISRQGGDEFIIVSHDCSNVSVLKRKIQTLIDKLSKPYFMENHEFHITASVGVSLFPQDGRDLKTLIKNADIAMYQAKENGKNNYKFFVPSMNRTLVSKMKLENELRHALDKGELMIYYQPQINIQNGKLSGVEALLRWKHPKHGMISPAEFIPLAEETGLIIPIGNWVINEACKQAKRWKDAGYAPLNMSVNISMRQFMNDQLIKTVEQSIAKHSLPPSTLKLEITESVAGQQETTIAQLLKLKKLGVSLALDDFGKGYSSLNYLKEFPVDMIKIDRSFISHIKQNKRNASIVNAVITVARSFRLTVLAEGVETEEELQYLKELQCDEVQGYIFSKPLAAQELEQNLQQFKEIAATITRSPSNEGKEDH